MLKDRVHDSADAKRRLNYIGNNFLHWGKTETAVFPLEQRTLVLYKLDLMSSLTIQGFLKPLHTDHVFGQCEGLALCLKAKRSAKINDHIKSARHINRNTSMCVLGSK